jgi:hypothetical protein
MPLFMALQQPQPDWRSLVSPILIIVIKCLAVGIKYLNVCAYFSLSLKDCKKECCTYYPSRNKTKTKFESFLKNVET